MTTTCYRCGAEGAPKETRTCEPCQAEIYRSNPLGTAWRPQAQRPAMIQELADALAPFVGVRDQFPQTIQLIDPKLDGLTPITVTVTKAQFRAALDILASLEQSRRAA